MRTLGATGLPVSALGLGLAALGRPGYINLGHAGDVGDTHVEAMERHAHQVLDAAYEGGVRYFDAARSYGRAEAFLSSWLRSRGLSRDDVTVGSKWGYTYTAGWRVDAEAHEVKDLSVGTLRRQLGETRALVGEHLALYQIHSATLESGILDDAQVRQELAGLREEGVRVGFTATGPRQAATIERALEVGGFDAVQATWNLHERSTTDALAAAHEAGLGVIVKEALANGRLTERGDADGRLTAAARWRWRPSWPGRGSTSSSAARRRSTPCAATWPPSTRSGTRGPRRSWRRWPSRPTSTGSGARSWPGTEPVGGLVQSDCSAKRKRLSGSYARLTRSRRSWLAP
jgi:aryl-alcohol dehydrogenase-like predicted oxidoreductase